MKGWLGYTIFTLLFAIVTFFGLGPVLLADGTPSERIITLLTVLLVYALIFFIFRMWRRKTWKK